MLGVLALYHSCIDERNQALKLVLVTFAINFVVDLDLCARNRSIVICIVISVSNTTSNSEAHLEPLQTSMQKLFGENIYSILSFHKKLHHVSFRGSQMLFSSYKFPCIVNKIAWRKLYLNCAFSIKNIILCAMYLWFSPIFSKANQFETTFTY